MPFGSSKMVSSKHCSNNDDPTSSCSKDCSSPSLSSKSHGDRHYCGDSVSTKKNCFAFSPAAPSTASGTIADLSLLKTETTTCHDKPGSRNLCCNEKIMMRSASMLEFSELAAIHAFDDALNFRNSSSLSSIAYKGSATLGATVVEKPKVTPSSFNVEYEDETRLSVPSLTSSLSSQCLPWDPKTGEAGGTESQINPARLFPIGLKRSSSHLKSPKRERKDMKDQQVHQRAIESHSTQAHSKNEKATPRDNVKRVETPERVVSTCFGEKANNFLLLFDSKSAKNDNPPSRSLFLQPESSAFLHNHYQKDVLHGKTDTTSRAETKDTPIMGPPFYSLDILPNAHSPGSIAFRKSLHLSSPQMWKLVMRKNQSLVKSGKYLDKTHISGTNFLPRLSEQSKKVFCSLPLDKNSVDCLSGGTLEYRTKTDDDDKLPNDDDVRKAMNVVAELAELFVGGSLFEDMKEGVYVDSQSTQSTITAEVCALEISRKASDTHLWTIHSSCPETKTDELSNFFYGSSQKPNCLPDDDSDTSSSKPTKDSFSKESTGFSFVERTDRIEDQNWKSVTIPTGDMPIRWLNGKRDITHSFENEFQNRRRRSSLPLVFDSPSSGPVIKVHRRPTSGKNNQDATTMDDSGLCLFRCPTSVLTLTTKFFDERFKLLTAQDRTLSLPVLPSRSLMEARYNVGGGHSAYPPVFPKKPSLKKSSSIFTAGSNRGLKTSSNTGSAKASVSFTNLAIREYYMSLSDQPSCSFGPPIGWEYRDTVVIPLDEYEENRLRDRHKRSMQQLVLGYNVKRPSVTKRAEHTPTELTEAAKEIESGQRQRTGLFIPVIKSDELMKLVVDRIKSMFFNQSRNPVVQRGIPTTKTKTK